MAFIEAIPASELRISANGVLESGVGVEVTLQAPLVFRTHFALAEEMLSKSVRQREFLLHHLEFEDVSISTVKVQRVLASRLISCASAKLTVVVDPLEQSLKDYLGPTQTRRMGNKQSSIIEDSSSGSESEHSSREDSDKDIHDQPERKPVPPQHSAAESASIIARPPTSSFFWTEDQLGLRDIHIAPTSRSKCFICSREIARNDLRGSWAYHCRKPHRYIHGSCIPRVDGQRGQRALQIIETILADANHDIRRDIAPRLAEIHDKCKDKAYNPHVCAA